MSNLDKLILFTWACIVFAWLALGEAAALLVAEWAAYAWLAGIAVCVASAVYGFFSESDDAIE